MYSDCIIATGFDQLHNVQSHKQKFCFSEMYRYNKSVFLADLKEPKK
jgi:hypothetical protein